MLDWCLSSSLFSLASLSSSPDAIGRPALATSETVIGVTSSNSRPLPEHHPGKEYKGRGRRSFWRLCVALLIYLFVELLQKCQVVQLESLKTGVAECIVMDPVGGEAAGTEEEDDDDSENAQADTGLLQPDAVSLHDQSECLEPNLHLLGYLFLSRPMSHAFNFIILFQFISIGISYVLAGSEAYAALLNVSHIYVIPAFTWILTLAILVAHTVIQPITSLLTLLKGILLIVTVAVTFAVGSEVGLQSSSDFTQMGKPFLMGTVALGGIVNVMPLLYSRISHNRTQIMWFRRAVLGGLTTCTVLNILWCWAVLEIVPQTSTPERRLAAGTSPDPGTPLLHSNISLEESERAGEIATIPLTKIINERYKAYSWVAELIQVFVAISVTVSFLVMGSAMKHTIDGVVSSLWSSRMEELSKSWERRMANKQTLFSAKSMAKGFMSLLAFLAIFIVSVCDPQSFIIMLEKVVSFSLNTEVGLFIFIMLRESREDRFKHMAVPLPVGECVFSLSWLLPTYFLFAVTYDVLQTVADVAHYIAVYSHSQDTPPHNVTGGLTAANASILL
ncbi:uncharacterized protein si:ch211-51h4.2 isoform X2 [Gymnodraco acuticeps]|uniref:Uncharacterized protein si:ch211-51h4.2 isoform X2 n=1 Tax=Gymnodraco acuticeps TaxID=8218 RepID=A0A6P8U575_GYMAC|nr:uncharacterized protein si:ch211-51h4.2 isoform X2 [Gymnodraco acuticeps]